MPKTEITTTTAHRGLLYDVMVNTIIPLSSLAMQTIFSCSMEIAARQFSLIEQTMYLHRTVIMRAIQVSRGSRHHTKSVGEATVIGILVLAVALGRLGERVNQ
jgi:hypothetical protein